MQLIDSHCHFDDARFDSDRDKVYRAAREAGVAAQIVPAVTRERWADVTRVCADYPDLFAAYGLHPMFTPADAAADVAALDRTLQRESAVALGECGLDFFI